VRRYVQEQRHTYANLSAAESIHCEILNLPSPESRSNTLPNSSLTCSRKLSRLGSSYTFVKNKNRVHPHIHNNTRQTVNDGVLRERIAIIYLVIYSYYRYVPPCRSGPSPYTAGSPSVGSCAPARD
jgi:hypothetical protein